jgi:hypothetical protein
VEASREEKERVAAALAHNRIWLVEMQGGETKWSHAPMGEWVTITEEHQHATPAEVQTCVLSLPKPQHP